MIERDYLLVPETDGITHINIYSKGKTLLGRMLSNFYYFPFETKDGKFCSVEGLWHWLGIEPCKDKEILRVLYGYKAKEIGMKLKKMYKRVFDENFEQKILKAIEYKIYHNLDMFTDKLKYLPFEYYYVFGDKVVDMKEKYKWMIDGIDKIRNDINDVEKRVIRKV